MAYLGQPSHDKSAKADRGINVNPDSTHNSYSDPVVDATNDDTTTIRKVVSLENYKDLSITWILSGGVIMTFWVSDDPDADDSADTGWQDVTNDFTGSATQEDSSGSALVATVRAPKLMVKYITSDASNATNVWVSKGN